jgi:hypothetical protein
MQHWCTLVVFPKQRVIRFYDSLLNLPDTASPAEIDRITSAKAAPYVTQVLKYVRYVLPCVFFTLSYLPQFFTTMYQFLFTLYY